MPARVALLLVSLSVSLGAADALDFFESRIRPVLAAKCYACHNARNAMNGLALDTRDAARTGGKRGPAVVPGKPAESMLLEAISQSDSALRMPPAGKLTDRQIADFEEWIRAGAEDPRVAGAAAATAPSTDWWAFRPFRAHPEPRVTNASWPTNWIDRFLLAKLESKQLRPAPAASKRTLLRRVTFDLTGLPPTPAEIDAFLADTSPKAWETVVERLLASPHYGERWARHWLDLARYAETDGHEFDREKPNAWRYRDWTIRALNQDLPFDRFVKEQIAGDLLQDIRLAPDGSHWDSPAATGFFGLHEERNAADDLSEVRAEKIDNQIDTVGKTFLGLTIACARCHDHKFDPIPTRDYYALAGVMSSKQLIQASLDSPARRMETERHARELASLARDVDSASAEGRLAIARESGMALASAASLFASGKESTDRQIMAWLAELTVAAKEPDHMLYPLAALAKAQPSAFADGLVKVRQELAALNKERPGDFVVADFTDAKVDRERGWRFEGPAFLADGRAGLPVASSFRARANEFTGFLYSKTFRAPEVGRYMHTRLAGSNDATSPRQPGQVRVSLVGDGRDAGTTPDPSGRFTWKTSGMDKAQGELLYAEIVDRSRNGHLLVDKIVISSIKDPPRTANPRVAAMLDKLEIANLADLAMAYQTLFELAAEQANTSDTASRWIAYDLDRIARAVREPEGEWKQARERHTAAAAKIADPVFGMVTVEDRAHDARLHVAGNHRVLGDEVPRGFLSAFAASNASGFSDGSGRIALANAIANPANPLTARVIVNRVWQHYFGTGLVRTSDNFGRMGEQPSHPELLDTMAAKFVAGGWSLKSLHRSIAMSSAYRMSGAEDPRAAAADPENRLLHRMPVRRLEGEAIRDAILAVSGSLDRTTLGPSVPPHISEYQDGRGKPSKSGPLDGDGRRSIYVGVRRNFLPPLLVAFDYPPTVTTIGRRGASTVPSQALMLMNNEFVAKQAAKWADKLAPGSTRDRIQSMYAAAFGRPADATEIERIERFLRDQSAAAGEGGEFRAWADLAHSLFNSKEFIFLR